MIPKTAIQSKLRTASEMFNAVVLSHLSGSPGETKPPEPFQPCAGHPEAVQEESREFGMFLEVLCLKLPTDRHLCCTELALKQKKINK